MTGKPKRPLFSYGRLSDYLQMIDVPRIVNEVPLAQFQSVTEDTLVEHLTQKLQRDPLSLYMERAEQQQEETQVDVSDDPNRSRRGRGPTYVNGLRVTISIPFSGDLNFWRYRPDAVAVRPPYGSVRSNKDGTGYLDIIFEEPSDSERGYIVRAFQDYEIALDGLLKSQREQIQRWNIHLASLIRKAVKARKQKLEAHEKMIQGLGIPLKRNLDAPAVVPLPLRRVIRPLPSAPKGGYVPEPGISNEDYDYILNVIRHEGRTEEATPRTYRVHDEEELRDILLAHLNGHFKGEASGETFRKRGKTDIRIERENRAAFVAECKIWRGGESFKEAADQLLGYLTWRDGKTALVFYNKEVKGFASIQQKIQGLLSEHDLFLRDKESGEDGEWRAVFRLRDDPSREVTVHVFLFDLFVE